MDPGITAALAAGFAAYAGYILPLGPISTRLLGVAAIVGLALVHIAGVKVGTRLLTALTILKLILVGALIAAALASVAGSWSHFVPFAGRAATAPPLAGAIAGALVGAFFSFGGWWEVTKIAGEVRDPARTLPRALWMGLVGVTLVYVATTLAFIYAIPIDQVDAGQAFVAQVGRVTLGDAGAVAVATVVIVCVLGSLGTMLMFAPRVYYAMAQDGLFPKTAAAVHPRYGTPARAIAIDAALASLLVAVGQFDSIVAYFVFISVVFIALTVFSVFLVRRRDATFSVPGYPWTPVAFLALVVPLLVLIALNNPLQAALGSSVVIVGWIVYQVAWRDRAVPASSPKEWSA
jgi:APA family basic amino acid/polyamine antiporter